MSAALPVSALPDNVVPFGARNPALPRKVPAGKLPADVAAAIGALAKDFVRLVETLEGTR